MKPTKASETASANPATESDRLSPSAELARAPDAAGAVGVKAEPRLRRMLQALRCTWPFDAMRPGSARACGVFAAVALLAGPACRPERPSPSDSKVSESARAAAPAAPTSTIVAPAAIASAPSSQERDLVNQQTFSVSPTNRSDSLAESAVSAEQARPEKLHDQMVRCLDFTVTRDDSITVATGLQVRVAARNRCDAAFSPADAWIEVRAVSSDGSGTAGRQTAQFQTTIESRGGAETILIVPCNPDRRYRFEASISPDAGAGRNAGE